MGLYLDYFEENRERRSAEEFDPSMIGGEYFISIQKSFSKLSHALKTCKNNSNTEKKAYFMQQLTEKVSELEEMKVTYLLGEKLVLSVKNNFIPQSSFMSDTICLLLEELQNAYHAVCRLIQKADKQMGKKVSVSFHSPSEPVIRKELLYLIGSSMLEYLKNSSVRMDTSEFRKTVCDFAELIKYFEQEHRSPLAKEIVRRYFEKNFYIKNSHLRCSNCGALLLEDIPYCLNCYERNEQ